MGSGLMSLLNDKTKSKCSDVFSMVSPAAVLTIIMGSSSAIKVSDGL